MKTARPMEIANQAPSRQSRLLGSTMKRTVLGSLFIGLSATVFAAPPDAGSLLRDEMRRDQAPAPLMPPKADAAADIKTSADTGLKMAITAFRVTGLTAVADAQGFLAAHANQSHSMEGLHRVAEKFEQWLRSRGLFLARAYIPPQDIKAGVVEIRVLEGRLEGIDIKRAPTTRLSDELLRDTLGGALPLGAALEQERLERGLLLLNDLPVASARAVLTPGKELGGSRVTIEAAQGPVMGTSVELDNTGNRFTGDWRLGAALAINDPSGRGDAWILRGTVSEGSSFLRAGYTLPIGSNGWRIGAGLIGSRYNLCCESSVTALDSDGRATAVSAFVSYPVLRTRLANLALSATASNRDFVNRALGVTTSDKSSKNLILAATGDWSDMTGLTGLGAYTSYVVQWTNGRLNLDGWQADKATDAVTAGSAGSFGKWTAQASHLLRVSQTSAVYAGLSGQMANKNLDSSEKFVLGGPQGVRAYPTGEASGDEGWLLNLEWRQELNSEWRVVGFVDHGKITLHNTPWANWNTATPSLSNRYSLSGAGVSAVWTPMPGTQISTTLATRLGNNPARDASGRDADNRSSDSRVWVQGSVAF